MHRHHFFSVKILPPPWCNNEPQLKNNGGCAVSFLLLGGGAELASVAQGPVLGGRAVAVHGRHEAATPRSYPRYHHCGGRRRGFLRELACCCCCSSRSSVLCTRVESSREGSIFQVVTFITAMGDAGVRHTRGRDVAGMCCSCIWSCHLPSLERLHVE